MTRWIACLVVAAVTISGCAGRSVRRSDTTTARRGQSRNKTNNSRPAAIIGSTQTGLATWYGADWDGKSTASGERFNRRDFTAAHLTLRMGSRVRVRRVKNGKSVVVRINDRGPYDKAGRRIIDLSEAAAKQLDMIDDGVAEVTIELLSTPN
jgi:rare lipoprotein A (peptidoglycan hydrolase)